MNSPPKPPPCRLLCNYEWINEWELVEWYTKNGKRYGEVHTDFNILNQIFLPEYKKKLLKALEENCRVSK